MTADSNDTPRMAEHRPIDEHANLITHALGFVLSIAGSIFLTRLVLKNRQAIQIVACGIYCCSLMGLYGASTLSHMFHDLAWRRFFRTLDQVCIFLLIAGSFTPIAVVFLWDHWWPTLLVIMWVLAIFGVVVVLRAGYLPPRAQITYGLLGWLPIISIIQLYNSAPVELFVLFVGGGAFYSTGSVFLRFDQQVRYFHALWHTFVIGGSTCHYIAILLMVM